MTLRQRKARSRRNGSKLKRRIAVGLGVLALCFLVPTLSLVTWIVAQAASAPAIEELQANDPGASSEVFAADGSRLGFVQSDEIRTPVATREMPVFLRRAVVAIEDERFYQHKGVDYAAIVRAGLRNVSSGKTLQGGSTITQQLVRALYIKDPERNLARKIKEAKLASELEKTRSKAWILNQYLNTVPFGTVNGRTSIGVEAAAETYFSKHARDLTLDESALLAGLPQAPSQYNPFQNPTAALERRNDVLRKMAALGFISRGRALRASRRELGLDRGNLYTKRREPYFFDYVQDQLIDRYGLGVFRRGGLKVHTTVDPKLQEAGRRAIAGQLGQPGDPSAAVVAIDPKTGHVRAMATSGNYNDRSFNLAAQGRRQPGSAFKTMVLTAAIRRGIDPNATTYVSRPLSLNLPSGPWKVETYDQSYGGRMNLVKATLKSDNTVYAQLDLDLTPKAVTETAKLMGIKSRLINVPSEGLGGLRYGVSPLEMANAYATLAAGGIRSEPKAITKVEFPGGNAEELGEPERKRVFSDGVAYEVTKILQQNVKQGTGTRASIGCPAAGKTGTTDNFNDAWFVGYTPNLATAVWVGYPNALKEMRSVHGIQVAGGTFPAAIWQNFMSTAKGGQCNGFPSPTERVAFRPFSGRYASGGGGSTYARDGTGTSAGGGNYQGYDRRVYASPPPSGGGGGTVGGGGRSGG
ncbi:MAG: transglycosylase domain-containing protein, partial [Actinomycetota bacterium]|nr:transglycosylase domain-containing protein [Actinomycetota bacterium]